MYNKHTDQIHHSRSKTWFEQVFAKIGLYGNMIGLILTWLLKVLKSIIFTL